MKSAVTKTTLALLITASLGLSTASAWDKKDKKEEEAALLSQAKVSREAATKTALAKVKGGTLKEDGEIEKEKGRIVWSFDIAKPGSKDITEVMIDAVTGKVVSVEKENPKAQAKEKLEDAKHSN
jgi:uncharacterized membrane protein YkoI